MERARERQRNHEMARGGETWKHHGGVEGETSGQEAKIDDTTEYRFDRANATAKEIT